MFSTGFWGMRWQTASNSLPPFMNWYYHVAGGHTHVRVFMNGGKCGDLCFRNEEFLQIRAASPALITFFSEA
jgi:hypothetical protein